MYGENRMRRNSNKIWQTGIWKADGQDHALPPKHLVSHQWGKAKNKAVFDHFHHHPPKELAVHVSTESEVGGQEGTLVGSLCGKAIKTQVLTKEVYEMFPHPRRKVTYLFSKGNKLQRALGLLHMAEKNESWGLSSEVMQPTADFPFGCQPLPSRQQSSWELDYLK